MKKWNALLLAVLAINAPFVTLAGGAESRPNPRLGVSVCMNLQDTAKIFSCLTLTLDSEDLKLNQVYGSLVSLLRAKEPNRVDMVRRAQFAWIRLRDNDCDYESSAHLAGEASGSADLLCRIRETMNRRAILEFKLGELKEHLAQP